MLTVKVKYTCVIVRFKDLPVGHLFARQPNLELGHTYMKCEDFEAHYPDGERYMANAFDLISGEPAQVIDSDQVFPVQGRLSLQFQQPKGE